MHTNKVMAFGHELGCGFLDKQHKYQPTEIDIELAGQRVNENVTKIFAGHNRSGVLLEDGRLLMWGEWFNGAKQRRMKEIRVNLGTQDRIKKVAIGKMHALMVTDKGKVYSWGDNTYGELGLGRNIKGKDAPTLIRDGFESVNAKFLDVAAGARHSLVLEENGRIYSFGDNSEGQCGIENSRSYLPVEIHTRGLLGEEGVKTRFLYAGDAHSAIVTSDGDMFAWGDNSAGRLGIKTSASVFRPTLVDDLMGRNIINVGLGGFFSIAVVGPANHSLINRTENTLVKQLLKQFVRSGTLALPLAKKPQL
jgi:hypothetical protein